MQIISESDPNTISLACEYLHAGKIISFATDTIYGIATDASNEKAVKKLYEIKQRNQKKPIAIFVKNLTKAKEIFEFDEVTKKIAENNLPGALTMVLKVKDDNNLAHNLNYNKDGFLGFRIVDRQFIKKLLEEFNGNLAVTSANISTKNPAISSKDVKKYFEDSKLDLLVEGSEPQHKVASTVIKILDGKIEILRQGAIKIKT